MNDFIKDLDPKLQKLFKKQEEKEFNKSVYHMEEGRKLRDSIITGEKKYTEKDIKLLGVLVIGLLWCNTSFAEVIKIDCQLSETPGLELPSEDLILLKQRTKPTFKINLDSKEVIAFNYGHSNKNNVKIGMVKISDSEKIVWDKEPYKANLVTYHRMTYHKNEKKLLEESIMTKNFETMKEIIEKGKTNDFFIRNEYIYKCK